MKQIMVILVVAFIVSGCRRNPRQRIDISDVTKPITLTLEPPHGDSHPINYLTLNIRGRINGRAQVTFGDCTNSVGSRFTIERTGNFSGTNCIIRYIPQRVTYGAVTIQYAFDE